ncbi:MAG: hypothetical protein HY275_17095 [Gemmatimonadetes bacterium]|nr:hypothetical protein [Gemmatimonadota bacterium]
MTTGDLGNAPGTCPTWLGGDPAAKLMGCVSITGQLLRPDGTPIPFSSVGATYTFPGIADSLRGTLFPFTDGEGRFSLSDLVFDFFPADSARPPRQLIHVRLYAKSGWRGPRPVDSLDIMAQYTPAGEVPPRTNIVWKTANVP